MNNGSYFYFCTQQNGLNTEYYRIKEINQTTNYLGIPIEAKIYLMCPHFIRYYCKLGFEFNYQISNQANVIFNNEAMNSATADVIKALGKAPDNINMLGTFALGIKIGKENKPTCSIEGYLPTGFFSNYTSTIVTSNLGYGISIKIQFPLNYFVKKDEK